MDIETIFNEMPRRYKKGAASKPTTYYFSIGDFKATVKIDAEGVTVDRGKSNDKADVILKTTPELFIKMVIEGKMPGPLDIARGKVKTNDPMGLQKLRTMFNFE